MKSLHAAVIDVKRLELLADGTSPIHHLDARAKVLVTFIFIVTVVSLGQYEISRLLPFCLFPVLLIARANLPTLYLARKIILICPFIVIMGMFNPFFDRTVLYQIGTINISGGWLSLISLIIRSLLTVSAAFILIATTGFAAICQAVERLGVPQIFAVQLLFLNRYIFVLSDEASRSSRARELRSNGKKGMGIAQFGSLLGHLLLRTWQRAERIHKAMLARGFVGRFHVYHHSHFGSTEFTFLIGWSAFFIFLRCFNIPEFLATIVTGLCT
jgi:cobalt/nickel transport system permease protein